MQIHVFHTAIFNQCHQTIWCTRFSNIFFIQKLFKLNLQIYNQRELKNLKYAIVLFHSKVRQIQLLKVFIRSIFNALFYHMYCNSLIFISYSLIFISWNSKSFSFHVFFLLLPFFCSSLFVSLFISYICFI